MYVDAIHFDDKIYVWYRDGEELIFLEEDAPYYCYVKNENGNMRSMFGDKVSKKTFIKRHEYTKYIKGRNTVYEGGFSPLHKFLSDTFYLDESENAHVGFFDIEVDYELSNGLGYPRPNDPFGEINSISLFNNKTKQYHIIYTNEKEFTFTDDEYEVISHKCVTERQVLDKFVSLIEDIDILSSWNGDMYDIPYIIQRCMKIYGKKAGMKKLCRDGFSARSVEVTDNFGNEYTRYVLVGRTHVDYMILYKKFSFGERTSYSLDSISEHELKEKKLEYKGDLGELYRTDPKTFFEYSLHDSRLLLWLDNKMKFIDLMKGMAKQSTLLFNEIFGSIRYLEHSIRNYCHYDRRDVVVLPTRDDNARKEDFPGAFVLETKAGAYGWTSSIDLASLYPSVIRSINISPETHIFQCRNNEQDFTKIVEQRDDNIHLTSIPTGEQIELPAKEVYDLLRENNFTISAYGSIFEYEKGLIPEVLALWYKRRKEMKSLSKKYYKQGVKDKGDYYLRLSDINKVGLNSLYGAISNPYSIFYSIFLAASVTTTGQIIEKFQMWKADEFIEQT